MCKLKKAGKFMQYNHQIRKEKMTTSQIMISLDYLHIHKDVANDGFRMVSTFRSVYSSPALKKGQTTNRNLLINF